MKKNKKYIKKSELLKRVIETNKKDPEALFSLGYYFYCRYAGRLFEASKNKMDKDLARKYLSKAVEQGLQGKNQELALTILASLGSILPWLVSARRWISH